MSFLVDTCVVSELTRPSPDADAVTWFDSTPADAKFISVVTLSEVQYGIMRAEERKQAKLRQWYERILRPSFADRVLAFDEGIAARWALLRAGHHNPPILDSQIAATALFHGLTVVTRNVKDFAFQGLSVFNPWRK